MSALDPVVSARPAYLPTGPREEYRGERPVYRRDVGPRGGAAPGGAQASIPSRPTITVVKTDQIRAESREPVPALSAEPSTSQEAIAVQPTTPTSTNPATHLPQAGPSVSAGEPPQDINEAYNGGGQPGGVDFNPAQLAVFTEGSQKDRILAAVAHGARTTTEITQRTGLLREQVHKAVGWLVKKGELQDMPNDEERTVELAPSPGTRGVHSPVQDRPAGEPAPAAAKTAPTQDPGSQWNDPIGKVLEVLLSNDTVSLTALCTMTGLTRDEGLRAIDALDASLLEMKGDDEFIERFHGDDDEIWYQYMTATMDPAPQTSPAPARETQGHPAPATDELIDQLEEAATEAFTVLRDAFSRLADLARENAAARDRLTAVQKLLGGED
ncbi:hypothetical protein [Acidithiobacillus sp.]|uniref:hypothetical protein n=1 Tax=Acidithiobacillus sp. TaxID=1872118 RepID=UPI0025C252BD|nr:hypothetical protein [Acidithiobacillus sp.]